MRAAQRAIVVLICSRTLQIVGVFLGRESLSQARATATCDRPYESIALTAPVIRSSIHHGQTTDEVAALYHIGAPGYRAPGPRRVISWKPSGALGH
jgi:hypothetical protein